MTVTMLSGRELNQDLGRAKRATRDGPVIITDRAGLRMSSCRLIDKMRTLGDMLAAPGADDVDLPLPQRTEHARSVDLS